MQFSHSQVFLKAWPIILANASTPLLGLVDTAIVGNTGTTKHLGGLALAALIFNFIFWAFGFLRMSTTGFVAQHYGAKQWHALYQTLARGLALAWLLGGVLLLLQWPIQWLSLMLFQGSAEVEQAAKTYFTIRLWGAPATLSLYVVSGLLIGLGKTGQLLTLQLALNGCNAVLSIALGYSLGWGLEGIAYGTLIAEWLIFLLVASKLIGTYTQKKPARGIPTIALPEIMRNLFYWADYKALLTHNRDIFIRTLFLLLSFAWFTNASASYGDSVLAANHILLQFISFSAFFLDGFAFVVEGWAGYALGAQKIQLFKQAVLLTTQWALGVAALLAASIYMLGVPLAAQLTQDIHVITVLQQFLPWACLYIALSFLAFQLDGIFIGATQSAAMRNASVLSSLGFIALFFALQPWGVTGQWLSFIGYVVLRALALLMYWPKLLRAFNPI